jgi:hypothetical protein
MNSELEEIIKYDSESSTLDYKKEEYILGKNAKRNEILKDISAFANHHSNNDKFIIVGIKEENGIANEFFEIENITDEATYQQFISDNIEPKINFEYKATSFEGKKIAYFKISKNKHRPYLFKKNIQNPINQNTEYKIGDGYIRIGSSSKKLDRDDFENIYKKRYTEIDRKNDLVIEHYLGIIDNEKLPNCNVNYLDIKLINNSVKSLDFDIEIAIPKSPNYLIISESVLLNTIKEDKVNNYDYFIPKIAPFDFNNNHEVDNDCYVIKKSKNNRKAAMSLAQNEFEKDIFSQSIIIIWNNYEEIKSTLIIRSNDFTEGQLKKELVFKK